uniref:SpoVT-AbrB domain-containing protein n=1 Tax=candidate division WOR-3 bacterium TaxID=2052148 RepID=A0A7V3ZWS3_UNCW3
MKQDILSLIGKGKKEYLQTFDRTGRIYIPKEVRDQFPDCVFYITVSEGKIVLNPIKIND